jgi:hypothetical protein
MRQSKFINLYLPKQNVLELSLRDIDFSNIQLAIASQSDTTALLNLFKNQVV